jgi:hypothetical protein
MKFLTHRCFRIFAAAGLAGTLWLPSAVAQSDEVNDVTTQQVHELWRTTMHQISAPGRGCFQASYPSTKWEEVSCEAAPGYRSALARDTRREQTVGNGYDYVALAPSGHVFSSVAGSFPTVTGVKTEKSVGVRAFGDGGILGTNEYTLQVNTNFYHSAACDGYAGCLAWQQYVLSTNTPVSLTSSKLTGNTEVFIEYWLINYGSHSGSNVCPAGFVAGGADAEGPGEDCVQNTAATLVSKGQIPITDLASLKLSGSATPGGTDAATVTFGTSAYTATVADSLTDIASGWTQGEFNVLGNAGGSKADFNSGASLTVKVAVTDGTTTAPTCSSPSSDDGTTGETNNLTLGKCTTSSAGIQFTESD